MENITNRPIIIVFIVLIAMILPFSAIDMADAVNEKKDEKEKKFKELKEKAKEFKEKFKVPAKHEKNTEAAKIFAQLEQYKIAKIGEVKNHSAKDLKEIDKLEKALEKSQDEYKEKYIDKQLQKDLKKAQKLIHESDIPISVSAIGFDHLYIQLSAEDVETEVRIGEIMEELELPYTIEYDKGFQRVAGTGSSATCQTTHSECNPRIGGIDFDVKTSIITSLSCTLSIPMHMNGIEGFLTAGHCFNGYSDNTYQPNLFHPNDYLGYSNSSSRVYEHMSTCDCAWIKDESSTPQVNGIFKESGTYWVIDSTGTPDQGDMVMMRGQHSNNGGNSAEITYDSVRINEDGIWTIHAMAFQATNLTVGDSGGAVFYNGKYMGILVAHGTIFGVPHVAFIPWNHITDHLSGLTL